MILAELINWHESRTAVLEHSNDSIYLYNHPHGESQPVKTLWVANTKKRLLSRSTIMSDMQKSQQPYLPKEFCSEHAYIKDYKNSEDWELQWGLDQNSVCVFYKGDIVAIMPEWSGSNDFYGYSKGAKKENLVAWSLTDENEQISRFKNEKSFLESWSDEKWTTHQENIFTSYDDFTTEESRYFSADGGTWPPLGIHLHQADDVAFLASVGMSILPMPLLGMNHENLDDQRQIELAILTDGTQDAMPLTSYLSSQALYPWIQGTHFDHGHTLPCKELAEMNSDMSFMLLVEKASFLPSIGMPSFEGRNVRLLYMIPIHKSEQEFAQANCSLELLKKLEQIENPISLQREAVA